MLLIKRKRVLPAASLAMFLVAIAVTDSRGEEKPEVGYRVIATEDGDALVQGYAATVDAGQGVLLTADSAFEMSRRLFQFSLTSIERSILREALIEILEQAHADASRLAASKLKPRVADAAEANVAYLAVPLRLLGREASVPPSWEEAVRQEVTLVVEGGTGSPSTSPVLGALEDYSRYRVRGAYTASEELSRYFRCFLWVTRQSLRLRASDSLRLDDATARRHFRQAILLTKVLEDAQDKLDSQDDLLTSLFGPGDGIGPADVRMQFAGFFERKKWKRKLNKDSVVDGLRADLTGWARDHGREPKVLDLPVLAEEATAFGSGGAILAGVTLLAGRAVPDSLVFQSLVFPEVGGYTGDDNTVPRTAVRIPSYGIGRGFPAALDLFAVMSVARARQWLNDGGDDAYSNYDHSLRLAGNTFREALAQGGAYSEWVRSLALLAEDDEGLAEDAAAFFRSQHWREKRLGTALAAWTGLRHLALLHAKQSTTAVPRGMMFQSDDESVYLVEPVAPAFEALARAHRELAAPFGRGDLEGIVNRRFAAALDRLADLARRTAQGAVLTQNEVKDWARPHDLWSSLWEIELPGGGMPDDLPSPPPVVVDVHTDGNTGEVLEQAIGYPVWLTIEGKDGAQFTGPVYTHYEFRSVTRLTDDEWRLRLDSGEGDAHRSWPRTDGNKHRSASAEER